MILLERRKCIILQNRNTLEKQLNTSFSCTWLYCSCHVTSKLLCSYCRISAAPCQRLRSFCAGICRNADCAVSFKYAFKVLLFESTSEIRETQVLSSGRDEGLLGLVSSVCITSAVQFALDVNNLAKHLTVTEVFQGIIHQVCFLVFQLDYIAFSIPMLGKSL